MQMGLWGALTGEVKRIFIARPDFAKQALVYKHPDTNIRKGTELTVEADEIALFFRDGTIRGTLPPGRHTLTTDNVPFLGMLIDAATGGNLYISEIYFVTTREMPSVKFGGPIGDLMDPQTEQIVSLGVYGEFSVKVSNPEQFVVGFVGLRKSDNDEILSWFKQLFLRTVKDAIAELIVKQKWPLLSVTSGAYTEEICDEAVKRAEPSIGKYGLSVVTLANFHASMGEDDATRLKQFANTAAMSKMTGGYQNYAMGEAMMHGGNGGGGGGGSNGMDMMGMMMAQQMMQNMQRPGGQIQSPFGNNAPAPAAPAVAAAPAAASDPMSEAKAKLAQLKELLKDELISAEEFEAKKKDILSKI
jgi:membrane protease subunit (stomatin/prohibitin family)